jgi:hypothetical protein
MFIDEAVGDPGPGPMTRNSGTAGPGGYPTAITVDEHFRSASMEVVHPSTRAMHNLEAAKQIQPQVAQIQHQTNNRR